MTDLPQRIEAAEGARKHVVENGAFKDATVILGGFCYIKQGDNLIVLELAPALAVADRIAAHCAAALRARKDRGNGE